MRNNSELPIVPLDVCNQDKKKSKKSYVQHHSSDNLAQIIDERPLTATPIHLICDIFSPSNLYAAWRG